MSLALIPSLCSVLCFLAFLLLLDSSFFFSLLGSFIWVLIQSFSHFFLSPSLSLSLSLSLSMPCLPPVQHENFARQYLQLCLFFIPLGHFSRQAPPPSTVITVPLFSAQDSFNIYASTKLQTQVKHRNMSLPYKTTFTSNSWSGFLMGRIRYLISVLQIRYMTGASRLKSSVETARTPSKKSRFSSW